MSLGYQVCTATIVHFRKIEEQVRRPYPAGTDCAWWARDPSQRVTRPMANLPPYDRTTPPSTPQSDNHSQKPRLALVPQTTGHCVNPRDGLPAVWPRDHSPPREYGPQDDLYNRVTMDPYSNMAAAAARAAARDFMNIQEAFTLHIPSNNQTQSTQPIFIRRNQERETPRLITPLPPASLRKMATQDSPAPAPNPVNEPKPRKESKPASKLSATAKATGWVAGLRKRRRPVFNADFSFNVASRRRSSDRTLPISPRTSVSLAAVPPVLPIEEPLPVIEFKHVVNARWFPFDSPRPGTITRGRGLTSPEALASRDSSSQAPTISSKDLTTPLARSTTIGAEAHPGQLVDFTSPTPSSLSEYKLRIGTEAFHDYLATSHRRKSFPTGDGATKRHREEELKMLAKLEKLDTEAKEFSASKASTDIGGRKRACTLGRRDRTSRKFAPRPSTPWSSTATTFAAWSSTAVSNGTTMPVTPSTSSSDSSESPSSAVSSVGALRRTISNPSTEAFLAHVRASVEARKSAAAKWQRYPVFADEVEKGFLGDEPL